MKKIAIVLVAVCLFHLFGRFHRHCRASGGCGSAALLQAAPSCSYQQAPVYYPVYYQPAPVFYQPAPVAIIQRDIVREPRRREFFFQKTVIRR